MTDKDIMAERLRVLLSKDGYGTQMIPLHRETIAELHRLLTSA